MSAATAAQPHGRYDSQARRASQRHGRERGCWVYIAAEELQACGYPLDGPPPFYRIWPGIRGGLRLRVYRAR